VTLNEGQSVTCTITNNDIPDEVEGLVLPFTGFNTDEVMALGIVLTLAGLLAVVTSRRREEDEGLDR
jgi:LPXTG-motif cell wall-anchored protein